MRYKNIARISDQIDRVLHHDDMLDISELDEGELSILHTEIRKMTLRIREQNAALKTEKAHLADSLADIAHQLRTPLTSVSLLISLLANNPDENERKTFSREAEEFLLHMDWLITSLLKLSRLDAGIVEFQTEQIDINNLINASIHPFLIPMELHNITIQTNIPEGTTIAGDSAWLSEAMQNILKNCMESTGENGMIEIACQDNPLFTEMTIHDNGTGIENEDLPRLFERFYRGKNQNHAGYGIGLALSKMIITRHDGTITAENHPQGGAIFTIRFPK
jgi:signal transduction histidine kinase